MQSAGGFLDKYVFVLSLQGTAIEKILGEKNVMSKKKKRKVSSGKRAGSKGTRVAVSNEFNPDYSIIKHDLKRIALLSGSFITLLVILSFFQDQILSIFIK